ncbi:MAG: hypothetical protein R3C03_10605 [Pirellulaceae bacterium]
MKPLGLDFEVRAISKNGILLFSFVFLTAAGYMLQRSLSDGLLLGELGHEALPLAMLLSAVFAGLFAWIAGRVRNPDATRRFNIVSRIVLLVLTLVLAWEQPVFVKYPWMLYGLFVLAELRAILNTVQFAVVFYESTQREERSKVGLLMSGAPLAGIVIAFAVKLEMAALGFQGLFYLVALLDLLSLIPIAMLTPRQRPPEQSQSAQANEAPSQNESPRWLQLKSLVAWLVVLKTISLTMVAYEWKATAADEFVHAPEQLTVFFAEFYGIADALTLLFQITLFERWVKRWGASAALVAYPCILLIAVGLAMANFSLTWTFLFLSLAKATEFIRRSWYDPSFTLVFAGFPSIKRGPIISWANSFLKPVTEASVVAVILFLTTWVDNPRTLTAVGMVAIIFWATNGARLRHWKSTSNT